MMISPNYAPKACRWILMRGYGGCFNPPCRPRHVAHGAVYSRSSTLDALLEVIARPVDGFVVWLLAQVIKNQICDGGGCFARQRKTSSITDLIITTSCGCYVTPTLVAVHGKRGTSLNFSTTLIFIDLERILHVS
ncbi:MAG: hypothetical protein ABL925_20215 [Methylococcales bacterium]